jgi:hypothetical protein
MVVNSASMKMLMLRRVTHVTTILAVGPNLAREVS